jgi:hypothetical protein
MSQNFLEYCHKEGGRLFVVPCKYKLAVVSVWNPLSILRLLMAGNGKQQGYLVANSNYKNLVGDCFLIQHLEYGFWNWHSHLSHLWYTGNDDPHHKKLASIQSMCETWGSHSSENGWTYPDDGDSRFSQNGIFLLKYTEWRPRRWLSKVMHKE